MLKVLSLFDGIATARYVLEQLGVEVEYYASEVDKYAITIATKNYPDIKQLGDVRNITAQNLPPIDLLIGGFPCQDLSVAKNNREGLKGKRSSLFYEMLRLHKEATPKYFIYENVASMAKDQKELITEAISKAAGVRIEPVLINAALVSAQTRKRLFWVGRYDPTIRKYQIVQIPQPEDRGIKLSDILESATTDTEEARTIDANYHKGGKIGGTHQSSLRNYEVSPKTLESIKTWNKAQAGRIRGIEGKSVTLQAGGGGTGAKTGLYAVPVALRNRGEGKKPEYNGTNKANSLTTVQTYSMVEKETIIRKLTPIECERLQSLPDNYTEGVSNSQRYKALGNAFNAEVIKHILASSDLITI